MNWLILITGVAIGIGYVVVFFAGMIVGALADRDSAKDKKT